MKRTLSILLAVIIVLSAAVPAALAEESGDRDDTLSLALSFIFPSDTPRDTRTALELLQPLAEAGDAEAQYYCGWIYDFELEENTETEAEAYKWYKLAAGQGFAKACIGAALNSFSEDYHGYLAAATEQGFWEMSDQQLGPDGLYWIGFMHYYGMGAEPDAEAAFRYYSAAAEMNSPLAMYELGYLYETGTGVKLSNARAQECYLAAAELEYPPAMRTMGYNYYFGSGSDEENRQAFDWFSKAAELGDAESMAQLAMMYQTGEGTAEDPAMAFQWYSRAVELGDTHAMCMLGHMYRDGEYVEEDDNRAMDLFIDAAVQGNISAPYVVEMMKAANEGMEVYNKRAAEYKAAVGD